MGYGGRGGGTGGPPTAHQGWGVKAERLKAPLHLPWGPAAKTAGMETKQNLLSSSSERNLGIFREKRRRQNSSWSQCLPWQGVLLRRTRRRPGTRGHVRCWGEQYPPHPPAISALKSGAGNEEPPSNDRLSPPGLGKRESRQFPHLPSQPAGDKAAFWKGMCSL